MSNKKDIVPKQSKEIALTKASSLFLIADEILKNKSPIEDDLWIDEFIIWSKKLRRSSQQISRNKISTYSVGSRTLLNIIQTAGHLVQVKLPQYNL